MCRFVNVKTDECVGVWTFRDRRICWFVNAEIDECVVL